MMCVDCGAEVPKLIDGSCAACFTKGTELLVAPEVIDMQLCAHCGARHVGAHWVDPEEGTPEEWVREEGIRGALQLHKRVENVRVEIDQVEKDAKTFAVHIAVDGAVQEVPVHVERDILLRRSRGVCDRCSRINGGFYAAIIQLRATDRDMTPPELEKAHRLVGNELHRSLQSGNRFAFLAKEQPMHGGWDYYIGDIDAGRNAARVLKDHLGGSWSEAAKLVGRRLGEDVYRVTFLVRVHRFTSGDIAFDGKRLVAIQAVFPKTIAVLDLEGFRKDRKHEDDLARVGGPELVEWATFVSQDSAGVQVVDPQTFQPTVVRVPDDFKRDERGVSVVRWRERLYWAPAPAKP